MSDRDIVLPVGLQMKVETDERGATIGGVLALAGEPVRLDAADWAVWLLAHGAWHKGEKGWTRADLVAAGEADGLDDVGSTLDRLREHGAVASFDPLTPAGHRAAERLRVAPLLGALGELSDGTERRALLGILGTPRRVSLPHTAFQFWKTAPLQPTLRHVVSEAVINQEYDDEIEFMTDADLFAELCGVLQWLVARGAMYVDRSRGDD